MIRNEHPGKECFVASIQRTALKTSALTFFSSKGSHKMCTYRTKSVPQRVSVQNVHKDLYCVVYTIATTCLPCTWRRIEKTVSLFMLRLYKYKASPV